jgi:hypothetical protein
MVAYFARISTRRLTLQGRSKSANLAETASHGHLGREDRRMRELPSKLGIAAALGIVILAGGMSGCSMFSPSNVPVDCNAVKNQEQAGMTDAKIASDLGATVDQVAACHGPKTAVGPQD